MEKQEFKIDINAAPDKIWQTLWEDANYRAWTSVFSEGSHAETDWKKGSKALFLDGNNQGMVSTMVDHVPNEYLSIKHLGTVKNGVEDLDSEETKAWKGALENYMLKQVDGSMELTVTMDTTPEYKDYFLKTWPLALQKIKQLAEKH